MATIRPPTSKDGSTRYTVTWRDSNGKQRGKTVGSKREATILKKRADAWGKTPQRQPSPQGER